MTPKEAIAFARKNDLFDQPDLPVRDQLADQARSMAGWAGLNFVIFSIPVFGWKLLGTAWSIIICTVFLGKGCMYAYEAMRLRTAVDCFDKYDAQTLDELSSLR